MKLRSCRLRRFYMGLGFEKMCQEYLLRYAADLPILLSHGGQWWIYTDSHGGIRQGRGYAVDTGRPL